MNKIIVGQVYAGKSGWEHLEESDKPFEERVRKNVDEFVSIHQPANVCINILTGPYAVKTLYYGNSNTIRDPSNEDNDNIDKANDPATQNSGDCIMRRGTLG